MFIGQGARREAMLEVIEGARQRLVLSLFRCRSLAGDQFRISEIVGSVSVIGDGDGSAASAGRWRLVSCKCSDLMFNGK